MGDWGKRPDVEGGVIQTIKDQGYRIVKLKAWGTWPKEWEHPTDNAVTLWEVTEEL